MKPETILMNYETIKQAEQEGNRDLTRTVPWRVDNLRLAIIRSGREGSVNLLCPLMIFQVAHSPRLPFSNRLLLQL